MKRGGGGIAVAAVAVLCLGPVAGCIEASGNGDHGGRWDQEQADAMWKSAPAEARLARVVGDPAHGGADAWPGTFDAPATAVDLDGDGTQELLVPSRDRSVYVFGEDGTRLAKLPSRYPASWHVDRVLNPVAADVLVPGAPMTIVATNPAAFVTTWQVEPAGPDGEMAFMKSWERRMDDCHEGPSMDGGATLADLDGDGTMDILVQTEEVGLFALRHDGSLLWSHCWGGGNGAPTVDDLDGDGRPEAIFASDSGLLSVFAGATGAPQWTFDAGAPTYGVKPASISVTPTVAELDGKPPKEILFTARHAPREAPDEYDSFRMAIFAVRQDPETWQAELVWMRQPDWAHPLSYTRLIVTDTDGDGRSDVFGMDWNTIGHRPGDWEDLGPSHVFRLDADGRDVWVRSMETWWSNKDIALADADGDGVPELLVNAPQGETDGIWRIDTDTGKTEGFLPAPGWQAVRGPQVGDLQGDGILDMYYVVEPADDAGTGGIAVFDLGVPHGGGQE